MPIFVVRREKKLTPDEIVALPDEAVVVTGAGDVVVQFELDAPVVQLADVAFGLGQAIPDGTLQMRYTDAAPEGAKASSVTAQKPKEQVEAAKEALARDPWHLVKKGDLKAALAEFADVKLDAAGRDKVRQMLRSKDGEEVALACDIARITGWKSVAVNLRLILEHPEPKVRIAGLKAIGALAGPALFGAVRPLAQDPDEAVRTEAFKTLEEMDK
jgi:hypothetical protein